MPSLPPWWVSSSLRPSAPYTWSASWRPVPRTGGHGVAGKALFHWKGCKTLRETSDFLVNPTIYLYFLSFGVAITWKKDGEMNQREFLKRPKWWLNQDSISRYPHWDGSKSMDHRLLSWFFHPFTYSHLGVDRFRLKPWLKTMWWRNEWNEMHEKKMI